MQPARFDNITRQLFVEKKKNSNKPNTNEIQLLTPLFSNPESTYRPVPHISAADESFYILGHGSERPRVVDFADGSILLVTCNYKVDKQISGRTQYLCGS